MSTKVQNHNYKSLHCFVESKLVSILGANRLGFFRFPYSRFPSTSALKKGRMFPPIGARKVLIFSFGMVWDFEKGFHQIHICDLEQTGITTKNETNLIRPLYY